MRTAVHLSVTRPGPWGSTRRTTLCERMQTLSDGMNSTGNKAKVTCKFCLKKLDLKKFASVRR